MFDQGTEWKIWKVIDDRNIVGFLSVKFDYEKEVGEIGLNAVDPNYSGKGIGTEMYQFALEEMKKEGMKIATVATGGDHSHLPARKAYAKAGFNVVMPSVWMCQELE